VPDGLRAAETAVVYLCLSKMATVDTTPEDMLPKPYFDWDYELYRTDRGK
jgi:hypothetical protein